ncbi:hypothetical protein ACCF70_002622 [Vibrio parahaemolyticus]|nr:hypothetical protein [Vibrio parahaemolyticus]EJM7153670.1 hypothetical protein [Vibrio parahaemolyticus]EJY0899264.1 hypothetical protein [Vibrio parahaemolyticus]EKO5230150.1 hypothetical protein [Vibrio parahaemolyticus]ELA7344320.1 hypothetical protein [Vibrio parahaemolyticus]
MIARDMATLMRHLNSLGTGEGWFREISNMKLPHVISTKKVIGNRIVSIYNRYPMYKINNSRIRTGLIAVSLSGCDIKNFFVEGTLECSAIDYINFSVPKGSKGDRAFAMSVLLHAAATNSNARKYQNIKSKNGRIEFISGVPSAKYSNKCNETMKLHLKHVLDKIMNETEKFRLAEKRRLARSVPSDVIFS